MGVCKSLANKGKTSLKDLLEDEAKFNSYMDTAFDKVDVDKNGYLEKEELSLGIKNKNSPHSSRYPVFPPRYYLSL